MALANMSFDREARRLPGAAFDAAWQPMKTSDRRLREESHGVSPRELLAKRMVEMSRCGEKNRDRFVENALSGLRCLRRNNGASS
jgi:hypothetical protein